MARDTDVAARSTPAGSLNAALAEGYLDELRERAHDRIENYANGGMGVSPTVLLALLDSFDALKDARHALRHLYPRPFAPVTLLDEEERWRREVVEAGLQKGQHPCRHGAPPCACEREWSE